MTGDRDLIQQYLDELRLSLRIPAVGRILVEAEDHLRAATAAGMAAGLTETEAQFAAIVEFGPVRTIVYAHQTRYGRMAAVLSDLAIALWRVAAFYLLVIFAIGLPGRAAMGAAGMALLAAYVLVRPVQRRRGRVWSVPLGGYFPLAVVIASVGVGVGLLLLDTSAHIVLGPWSAIIIYAAVGLAVTYGWRMLWNQARGRGELA
jgi:hypothetical protein